MKKLFFFLGLLSFSHLWAIELPRDWISGTLPPPTVFSANQYKDEKIINTINVFKLESRFKSVVKLRELLEKSDAKNQDVGDGHIIRDIQKCEKISRCYILLIDEVLAQKKVTQIWKFGEEKTISAQIMDEKNLDKKIKEDLLKYVGEL